MHFITQSIWLKALGWSLLNSFWQMALLWLLYQLITGMGKRFSSGTRHGLALSLSLAGTVGFLLTFLTSFSGLGPANSGLINWRVSGPFLGIAYWTRDLFNVLVPYLAILYLGSLCFLFFPYIQNYRRLRELRYEGLQKMPAQLRIFAQSLSSQMGIRRRVNLWLSSLVDSPLTVGFFKPIILIPIATVNQLSLEQVETILLHELAHIRRNDYLINLLITWMGTLFFFNPFCRLLIQTVGKEREHCCDDLVIQFKYNPHVYASALLSLEKSRDHHAALALAAIGRSRQLLLERIRRLTGQPGKRSGFNPRITAFFLVNLLICPGLFFQPRPVLKPIDLALKTTAHIDYAPKTLVSYIPPPSSAKTRRTEKLRNQENPNQDVKYENHESMMTWVVSSNQPSQAESESVASTAVLADDRDFSITAAPEPATNTPLYTLGNSFPYVPSTSFIIQESDDTMKPVYQIQGPDDPEARASMEKALLALNEINWKQLEKNINSSGKKINPEILRKEISLAFRKADWETINDQLSTIESQATIRSLMENIQLQSEALRKMHVQTKPAAIQLKLRIRETQLKLQQETLKKEIQIIQKQNESVSHGKRIVYI